MHFCRSFEIITISLLVFIIFPWKIFLLEEKKINYISYKKNNSFYEKSFLVVSLDFLQNITRILFKNIIIFSQLMFIIFCGKFL